MYAYEVKLKNFFVHGGSARSLEETEGASPGAPGCAFSPQSKSVVNGVTNRVKYTATGKPGKLFSMLRRCSPKRCLCLSEIIRK